MPGGSSVAMSELPAYMYSFEGLAGSKLAVVIAASGWGDAFLREACEKEPVRWPNMTPAVTTLKTNAIATMILRRSPRQTAVLRVLPVLLFLISSPFLQAPLNTRAAPRPARARRSSIRLSATLFHPWLKK